MSSSTGFNLAPAVIRKASPNSRPPQKSIQQVYATQANTRFNQVYQNNFAFQP